MTQYILQIRQPTSPDIVNDFKRVNDTSKQGPHYTLSVLKFATVTERM